MLHATRSIFRRWSRDQGPDGIQRRRALLARSRHEQATRRHVALLSSENKRLTVENTALRRRNTELADKISPLLERVPVYCRFQQDERRYGRTLVLPVAFNPDAIVRTLVFSTAERDRSLDLETEFRYLAAFASEKILAALREAAAERLGMPGRSP